MALEMAAFRDDSPPMSKEDFRIITTTQEGILNTLQIMSNEIANHTDIILKKTCKLRNLTKIKKNIKRKEKLLPRTKKKNQNMSALPPENLDTVLLTAIKKPQKRKTKNRPSKVMNASIAGK